MFRDCCKTNFLIRLLDEGIRHIIIIKMYVDMYFDTSNYTLIIVRHYIKLRFPEAVHKNDGLK